MCTLVLLFFFFKQKTAYDVRISDWSSDVCSSDRLAFLGPGYMVSVGYMDPGNWATDLAGGSQFCYTLLFVRLLSNVMTIVLQALSVWLGLAAGCDHAESLRSHCASAYSFFLSRFCALPLTPYAPPLRFALPPPP